MLSSDKNIDTLSQLISELRNYARLRVDLLKVSTISIAAKLLSTFVLCSVLFVFAALAIMLLSLMCVTALTTLTGSGTLAYALVIAAYILLAITVYLRRTQWIERPITHFLVQLILPNDEAEKENSESQPS